MERKDLIQKLKLSFAHYIAVMEYTQDKTGEVPLKKEEMEVILDCLNKEEDN